MVIANKESKNEECESLPHPTTLYRISKGMILIEIYNVASVLGTGAIRIDPETKFRGHVLASVKAQTF